MREVPQNLDAEQAVLGAMLLNRDAIATAIEQLTGASFYDPSNSRIFESILTVYLRDSARHPDVTVVAEHIRNEYAIPVEDTKRRLLQLQAVTPAVSNIAYYVEIVAELAVKRLLIAAGQQIAEAAYGPDSAQTILDESERKIFALAHRPATDTTNHIGDIADETIIQLGEGNQTELIPTGYYDIDESVRFRRQSLIVCAARPGQGKTAFALSLAAKVAETRPVLFFSMEMGAAELSQRILCSESRVRQDQLQTGRLTGNDWAALEKAAQKIRGLNFFVDDNPRCTLLDIASKGRRLATKGPLGLIVVDYLQLMTSTKTTRESRQVEVAELSRGLKMLARELDCPILALSQLNRGIEYRADKTPMLSDLRESGAIEQDADIVAFLHADEQDAAYNPAERLLSMIIAKNRHGSTGKLHLVFRAEYSRFENYTG